MADPWAVVGSSPFGEEDRDPWAVAETSEIKRRSLAERFAGNLSDFARNPTIASAREAYTDTTPGLEAPGPLSSLPDMFDVLGPVGQAAKGALGVVGTASRFLPEGAPLRAQDIASEEKKRRQELERRGAEDPWYAVDGSWFDKGVAGASTLAGQFVGGALDPQNLVSPGRSVVGKMVGNAAVNAAGDLQTQAADLRAGIEADYDPWQTVSAAAIGAGISGAQDASAALGRAAGRALDRAGSFDLAPGTTSVPDLPQPDNVGWSVTTRRPTTGVDFGPVGDDLDIPAPGQRVSPRQIGQGNRMAGLIRERAEAAGVDPNTAAGIALIESDFDPNARNPNSSAGGLYQFLDSTWQEMGGGNKFDPATNIDRGLEFIRRNQEGLSNALGREPAAWETYLAHQQGLGGATALLRSEGSAIEALTPILGPGRARAAILGNGGRDDMSAAEFAGLWRARWASKTGLDADSSPEVGVGRPSQDELISEVRFDEPSSQDAASSQATAETLPNAALEPLNDWQPKEPFAHDERAGSLWKLQREELETLLRETEANDADSLLRAFGDDETVREFHRLERARNDQWNVARADAASREFDEKFGNLTPEQERLVYGIGESGASPDDIRGVLRQHRDYSDYTDSDLVDEIASAIKSNPKATAFAKVREGTASADEQAQFLQFGGAYRELAARGTDPTDLGQRITSSLVNRGYGSPADTAEIVGGFVRDLGSMFPRRGAPDTPALPSPAAREGADTFEAPVGRTADQGTPAAISGPPGRDEPNLTDRALDALRGNRRVTNDQGSSLMDFIAKNGGVDLRDGGELSALDVEQWHRAQPFRPEILREGAPTLGDMAVRAQEAGYLPERFGKDVDTRAGRLAMSGGKTDGRLARLYDLRGAVQALSGEVRPALSRSGGTPAAGRGVRVETRGGLPVRFTVSNETQLRRLQAVAAIARDFDFANATRAGKGYRVERVAEAAPTRSAERLAMRDGRPREMAMTGPLAAVDLSAYGDRVAPQAAGVKPGGLRARPVVGAVSKAGDVSFSGRTVSQLAGDLNKALGLTAHRQGRIRTRGALGEYDTQTTVVRTKAMHEIDVLSHEGGHALEFKNGPALKAAISKHADHLETLAYPGANPSVKREEGFAEFFRWYVTNPAHAEKIAPGFHADFKAAIQADAPKMAAQLKSVQDGYQALLSGPSLDVAAASIALTGDPGKLGKAREALDQNGLGGAARAVADWAYTAFLDNLNPVNIAVRRLQSLYLQNTGRKMDLKSANNPYVLARLAREAYNAGYVDLMDGVVPYRGTEPDGPALSDALEKALGAKQVGTWPEQKLREFDAYLVARRMVQEYDRYATGKLKNPPDGKSLAHHQQVIADAERLNATWSDAAEIVYQWNRGLWRKKFDAGLISQTTHDAGLREHVDYVPLFRDMSDKGDNRGRGRGGDMRFAGGVRQFKGSTRDVISPLTSMMREAYETAAIIRRNDAIKALDDLAEAAGAGGGGVIERLPRNVIEAVNVNAREALERAAEAAGVSPRDIETMTQAVDGFLEEDAMATIFRNRPMDPKRGETVLFVWRDGVKTPLLLADGQFGRDMYDAFTGMTEEMRSLVLDVMAKPTAILRQGVTLSPEFQLRNIVRDQIATWINTDVGFTPVLDTVKGGSAAVRQDGVAKRYAIAGGFKGGANQAALERPMPRTDAEAKRQLQFLRRKGVTLRPSSPMRALASLTDFSETSTRHGVFMRAEQQAKKRGLNDYEAMIEAAFTARDYLDFGRHGSRMVHAARLVTFLNAALQGLDKSLRTLGGWGNLREVLAPQFGGKTPASPAEKRALAHAVKATARIGALAAFGGALAALYADDPEYQEINDQPRSTHWFVKAGAKWLAIPKPFELAIPSNILERALQAKLTGDPIAMGKMIADLKHTLLPPTDIPIVAVPFQVARNKDFQGRAIVPEHLRGSVDPRMQYTAYTSEIGKRIGAMLKVSPAVVDHVITGFGGSLGREGLQRFDQIVRSATGTPKTAQGAEDTLGVRAFVKDPSRGSLSQSQFWEQVGRDGGKLTQAEGSFRQLAKDASNPQPAITYLSKLKPYERGYVLAKFLTREGSAKNHPMVRAQDVAGVISDVRRELRDGSLTRWDQAPIKLSPAQRRDASAALGDLAMAEMRNALVDTGVAGWAQKDRLPISEPMQRLRSIDPGIGAALVARMQAEKIPSPAAAEQAWARIRAVYEGPVDGSSLTRLMGAKRAKSSDSYVRQQERARPRPVVYRSPTPVQRSNPLANALTSWG